VTRSTRRSIYFLATVAVLSVGCGPCGYLKKVSKEANRAVADAKAAGAEEWAPYEYWGAVSYLEQSKVMMAYSEYERSFDYGGRAKALAAEAQVKTKRREEGRTSESSPDLARPDEDPTKVAPAADAKGGTDKTKGGAKAKGGLKVGGGK
jgi:hypothetical protein